MKNHEQKQTKIPIISYKFTKLLQIDGNRLKSIHDSSSLIGEIQKCMDFVKYLMNKNKLKNEKTG